MEAVGVPFVAEFGLDDGKEALVELEQGFDFWLVLGVELALFVDLLEDGGYGGFEGCVLLLQLADHR